MKIATYACCPCWFFRHSKFLSFSLLFLFHNLAVCSLDLAHEFSALVPSSRVHSHTRQATKPPRRRKVLSQPVCSTHFTTQNIATICCTLGCVRFLGGTCGTSGYVRATPRCIFQKMKYFLCPCVTALALLKINIISLEQQGLFNTLL